ncbi:MAG: molybdopterin-dependent oxidoreductase [Clostridia bacterium]|nr:molybdopterin-dependent oxidoreductase [Clostridia bacterium]
MKKKKMIKALTGVTGAAVMLSGYAPAATHVEAIAEEATRLHSQYALTAQPGEAAAFMPVSDFQGRFSFDQDELSPSDDAFNLFGTVLTGMCAKPAFAFEGARSDYYINVGGNIKKSYYVNLKELESREESRVMLCSCATGPATANVKAVGVPVEDILQLSEDAMECNTVTFVSSDGYEESLPLSYVLEKRAMIVYRVNDSALPSGTQLYVPETVAKYFTRDVVDIDLSIRDEVPVIEGRDAKYRAQVAILNNADECEFIPGNEITFEGYADDCGDPIVAVEFSLDGGENWKSYATPDATADRWVYWRFAFTPETAADYQLSVRARTASGNVSPLEAKLLFSVKQVVI